MASRESDPRADDADPPPKFNPRLVPPLILLGLLLVVGLFALLSRGGPAKDEKSEKPMSLLPQAGDRSDEMEAAHGHGGMGPHGTATTTDFHVPRLEKADGGQTLAEIAAAPAKFNGQTVKVRGMIVKAQQRVRPALGQPATNWYRLQDSSGAAEPLLFTAEDDLKQGDLVTIAGKLAVDRDFGGGLRYKMIVEGASVTREKAAEPAESPAKTAGPDPRPE